MNISKQYKVVITNDCIKEIDDINKYISANLNSSNAAKLLMRKIKKFINNLAIMPKRYAVIMQNNKLKFEHRRIVINNYVIIYTISEKYRMVYVVHMYYGSMDYFDKIY